MQPQDIVQQWLDKLAQTAANANHSGHMDLISKKVSLLGVPGFETIGYEEWSNQCEHDFSDKLIECISYTGLKIRAATDTRIMFVTYESITTTDNRTTSQGIECLLEKEDDGQWRLVQQRVLSDEESSQYNPVNV